LEKHRPRHVLGTFSAQNSTNLLLTMGYLRLHHWNSRYF
jgi:hypothetical protein